MRPPQPPVAAPVRLRMSCAPAGVRSCDPVRLLLALPPDGSSLMPAPFQSLLADALDIPEDRAAAFLRAMMRKVRQKANEGHVIRIPGLGAFSEADDGTLDFTPAPGLARAVNRRYEGLSPEAVGDTATKSDDTSSQPHPDADADSATDRTDASGADTAEFQVPSSAISSEAASAPPPDGSEAASEPAASSETRRNVSFFDTIKDKVPDASRERSAPETASQESDPQESDLQDARPEADDTPDDTPDDAPDEISDDAPDDADDEPPVSPDAETLVDAQLPVDPQRPAARQTAPDEAGQTAAGPPAEAASDDEASASLTNVWNATEWNFSTVSSSDVEGGDDLDYDLPDDEAEAADDASDDAAEQDSQQESTSAPDTNWGTLNLVGEGQDASTEDAPGASAQREDEPDDAGQRRQDRSPEPSGTPDAEAGEAATPSQAEPQEGDYEPDLQPKRPPSTSSRSGIIAIVGLIIVGALGAGAWYLSQQPADAPPGRLVESGTPSATDSASGDGASEEDASEEEASGGVASRGASQPTESPSAGAAASAEAPPSRTQPSASPPASTGQIDPSAGGWVIVVASRTSEAEARERLATYRDRFQSTNLPLGIVTGTSGGATRHRVALGQFDSRAAVDDALQRHAAALPDGAWPLQLK